MIAMDFNTLMPFVQKRGRYYVKCASVKCGAEASDDDIEALVARLIKEHWCVENGRLYCLRSMGIEGWGKRV